MSELKPCPFCGGEAITTTFIDPDDFEYMPIEVNDCDAEVTCKNERCINGWWLSPKEWNNRPIEDALNARIAELEAAQRWIPVSERLPEIGVRVLFYNNFIKNIHKGWYSGDEWVSEIGVFYDGDKLKRITHWMPLPKFPEVQE